MRVPPVGAEHELPPVVEVAEVHGVRRFHEHERARVQQFFLGARIVVGVRGNLGERHVPRRIHERLEERVGHRRAIHPEAVDGHPMDGTLLRIVILGTHLERPAGDPHHIGKRRGAWRCDGGTGGGLLHNQLWHRRDCASTCGPAAGMPNHWCFVQRFPLIPRHRAGPAGGLLARQLSTSRELLSNSRYSTRSHWAATCGRICYPSFDIGRFPG